ncbi:MAG: hypothetical protein ABIQ18_06310 [Umezawaea sp.]
MPTLYPPNPAAWAMLTALGAPAHRWHGTVAITGAEDDRGLTAPLTDHHLVLIAEAHRRPCDPAGDPHPSRIVHSGHLSHGAFTATRANPMPVG